MGKGSKEASDAQRLARIKMLVVIAMFSDDDLMDRFVLKGGNAIDLAYRVGSRASLDVDLSMEDDFAPAERPEIREKVERCLRATFQREGYEVFDVTWEERPQNLSPEVADFWGGYTVTFKLIEQARYAEFHESLEDLRRNAIRIGAKGKFEIDISKFEHCREKQPQDMDGYRIFVYTPAMLVCEKLRALCQQMPEYGPTIRRARPGTARARDFVDICILIKQFGLDMITPEHRSLLASIFKAKRVPLELLDLLPNYREFHRPDFQAVKDTVKPGVVLESFDSYFDYVVNLGAQLKALGNE